MNINSLVKFQRTASVEISTNVSPSAELSNNETKCSKIREVGNGNNSRADSRTVNTQFYIITVLYNTC